MNEKQNTFNSMADRPLLMTSRWCKWGFHNWQKWGEVKAWKRNSFDDPKFFQARYCDSCHVYDSRRVRDIVIKE